MEKCEVGDRVQIINNENEDENGGVKDGEVVSITPPKKPRPENWWRSTEEEQKEFTTLVTVKWDDGSPNTEHDLMDLDQEDSEMERDFRKAVHYADEQIQAKLDEAAAALREATKIAERYGVPFTASVSPVRNQYYPRSLEDKFGGIDREFIQNVTDTYNEYDSSGWKHSQVC